MNDEVAKAARQMASMNEAAKQLESISRAVPAVLVASGRGVTQQQLVAALAAAKERLRFISVMTIEVDGKVMNEPVSQMEAAMGLAEIEKILAAPQPSTPPETAPPE